MAATETEARAAEARATASEARWKDARGYVITYRELEVLMDKATRQALSLTDLEMLTRRAVVSYDEGKTWHT